MIPEATFESSLAWLGLIVLLMLAYLFGSDPIIRVLCIYALWQFVFVNKGLLRERRDWRK